ncbi:HMG domain-containing protein 3 isoform X2 [Gouania willdenowi]|uniref:HMG domain-containing protein 3 isoform X2 n=1 Tax=Gouania willdenowi TaxID=441366 RepID=UPI001055EBAD|nr:HMG domain-containing protein 3 isoform X2 [Gouania willdenowi]
MERSYRKTDTTPKKRKSKAQEENVEKSKKPRSAYLLYYFDVYQVMQMAAPTLPQSEINKRISESWKRLSVAEKSHYLEKAKLEKEGVDTSSLSPSKDPPGFRKILPRTSYYIMSKGSSSISKSEVESEVSIEPLHSPSEGDLAQESHFSLLALAGELEPSESPIIVQDMELETGVVSPPLDLHGLPSSSSSSETFTQVASTDSQNSADFNQNTNETRGACSLPNVLQTLGEPGQMVAFIPSQDLLKAKSLVGSCSVGPVMVVSVGAGIKQNPKPSYKMPVKTYTRRGRGRCQNPGCSFVYLSRHKPTTCPECGSHLGGKWVPAAKRIHQKAAASQQSPQPPESRPSDSKASPSPVQHSNTNKGLTKDTLSKIKEESQPVCNVEPTPSSHVSSSQRAVQTKPESQFNPLGLDGEVELTENMAEGKEGISPSVCLQGTSSSSSFADRFKAAASTDSNISWTSADFTSNTVTLKTDETLSSESTVQQTCGKTATCVVNTPTQPVTTYTRRGRGRCHNPDCSFIYVSRHKPTACPDCGSYLGGNRTSSNKAASKQAASVQRPPEGTSTKKSLQTKHGKDHVYHTSVHRNPVRPILPACSNSGLAVFHIITVPPEKSKLHQSNNQPSAALKGKFPGLKPSTLRQLGQAVPATAATQESVSADRSQRVLSLTDKSVNILPVVPYKQHTVSTFDLGLSTARGRGCCKNPSCKYMYKNRHKPAVCPKCGCGLTLKNFKARKSETLLDPLQALSPAQKDIQRQNTLQLLRSTLQMPESEAELQDMLNFIHEVNQLQIVLVEAGDDNTTHTVTESGWPLVYESAATYCGLCNYPLFKGGQSTVAGLEDCKLLTETLMQRVSLQLKVCLNAECLALHSFTDLHPGLFNVGNKLLVTLDLFLKIQASIKLGQSPFEAARTLFDHNPNHPVHALSLVESSQIQDLLLSGYWAFESLTVRDYNDMICGVCGISPKIEIGQRYTDNVLELKNVEFTWPEVPVSDEVHVDDFWLTMENEAIEQAAFPTDIPITRVDASIIAPFTPPLMRSGTVINTEKDKVLSHTEQLSGDPSVLVRLIHDGELRLSKIEEHTEDELTTMLNHCGMTIIPGSKKTDLLASLLSFCTLVQCGLPTGPQPPPHRTAGKLSKLCPHKVVCASKYLVRGETARDHVDLLLSSRYWPPVYVCDSAHQVALCADMQYPELATQMWGRNQGCFSDPLEKPKVVSCAELREQPYSADLSLVTENQQVHPITKSSSCWMVRPPSAAQQPPPAEHHSMLLCRDLEPYVSQVKQLQREKNSWGTEHVDHNGHREECEDHAQNQPTVFSNAAYYYLYNRLVDFLTSRDIVNQQISQLVDTCQMGEVVIRDALYRLGVAQIKTEEEEDVRK